MLNRIHHAAIICSDYAVSKRFYTECLGLRVVAENYRAARHSYKLDLALPDGSQVELFSFPGAPSRPSRPEAQGLRHLAFEVDDVGHCKQALEALGIAVEDIRLDEFTQRRFVFFADPDGLPLELYEARVFDGEAADMSDSFHPVASAALDERFDGATLSPALRWFCEPEHWALRPDERVLRVSPDAKTDFWQRTHYGFEVDNGHVLQLSAQGDFVLTTRVTFRPRHQYDQAGLMLRLSPSCWIKTSVEFEPHEPSRLGVVVTNAQYSDWSTQPLPEGVDTVSFKLRIEGSDCIVQSSFDGHAWQQLRMAHLAELQPGAMVSCGLYACSPQGAGYEADFHFLTLVPGRE